MKKLILTALISQITFLSFTQQKHFNVGLSFSTHRLTEDVFLSGGVSFQYNFKNNLSLRTGLQYDRSKIFITNFNDIPYISRTYKELTYRNLELPIYVRYSIGGKLKLFSEFGFIRYYFLLNRMKAFVDVSETSDTEDYSFETEFENSSNTKYGLDFIFGTSYQLKNKFIISFSVENLFYTILNKNYFYDEEEKYEFNHYSNNGLTEKDYNYFKWLKFSLSFSYTFNIKKNSTYLTKVNGYAFDKF